MSSRFWKSAKVVFLVALFLDIDYLNHIFYTHLYSLQFISSKETLPMESFFKKTALYFFLIIAFSWLAPCLCLAHFGVLLPSDDIAEGNNYPFVSIYAPF